MICFKIPHPVLIYSFAFFAFSLFTLFSCSSSVSAVSDLTFSYSDCTSNCLVDWTDLYSLGYRFLILYFPSPVYQKNFTFQLGPNDNYSMYATFTVSDWSSPTVLSLRSGWSYRRFKFDSSGDTSASFVISENPPDLGGSSGIVPSGSLSISENGTYDVTNYAEAVVDVPPEIVQGDYHDDLENIKQAILICGGVLLVLYFFFAIYRLLIRSTGGWR